MKKKIVMACLALTLLLSACSGGTPAETTTAPMETTAVAETTIAETTTVSQDDLRKAYITLVTPTMNKNWGDNYKIEEYGDAIHICVWKEGIAEASVMVRDEPTEEYKAMWNQMKEGIASFSKSAKEVGNSIGYEGVVAVNVMNDINKDNVLLTFADGVCIYDVTEN